MQIYTYFDEELKIKFIHINFTWKAFYEKYYLKLLELETSTDCQFKRNLENKLNNYRLTMVSLIMELEKSNISSGKKNQYSNAKKTYIYIYIYYSDELHPISLNMKLR